MCTPILKFPLTTRMKKVSWAKISLSTAPKKNEADRTESNLLKLLVVFVKIHALRAGLYSSS